MASGCCLGAADFGHKPLLQALKVPFITQGLTNLGNLDISVN